MKSIEKITILGAGSWGTTLAWLYASSNKQVTLYTRNAEKAQHLQTTHQVDYPYRVELPENLQISSSLEQSLSDCSLIIIAVNSQSVRSVASYLSKIVTPDSDNSPLLISATKGLEIQSSKTMSQIILEYLPWCSVAALSGPNLAVEILAGSPAAAVIGCVNYELSIHLQSILSVPKFRIYASNDILGVELGGALKNIIAIAAGCTEGMKLGVNAKSALLTRGLAEISRFAATMGARLETLVGLSGMGDLIATCTSPLSRNYRLGIYMAQGMSLKDSLQQLGGTAEGVPTCEAVCKLAKSLKIELPITEQVEAVLKGNITPQEAIMKFMSRPLSQE